MIPERDVLIVDDDTSLCDSLSVLLATAGLSMQSFSSAEHLLESDYVDTQACVVVDMRLPGLDGLSLLKVLRDLHAQHVIVMITGHGDVPMAVDAMRGGAFHFVEKPFDPDAFLDIVLAALKRLRSVVHDKCDRAGAEQRYRSLSPREKQVLELLVEGRPSKLIAYELGISTRTAEHHRAAVMKKMATRSLSHLVRMALDLKLT